MSSDIPIGKRIRFFREGRGLTQLQMAMRSGLSLDYVGMIERGDRNPSAHALQLLAQVLSTSLSALRGTPQVEPGGIGHPRMPAIYDAMLGLGGHVAEVELDEMERRVQLLGDVWLGARANNYERTSAMLPGMIRDAEWLRRQHRAPEPEERRRAARLVALTYFVTRQFAKSVARSEVGVLAADRCVQAAEAADDPFLLAAARWHLAGQLLHDGQFDGAEEVARTTIEGLRPVMGEDPVGLSMYGQMHLLASIVTVRKGSLHGARRYLEEAVPIAEATGETNAYWTVWGPMNVRLHAVAVEAEGSNPHDGLRAAEAIDDDRLLAMPSIDRRSRHLMYVAWLYDQLDEDTGVVLHLKRAEQEGPEEVRYNLMAHQMVGRLLTRARSSYKREVVNLAERLGMLG
jgi:transcriptional regulator with XRE-family HTH domain